MGPLEQVISHALGDYVIQSHWMATEKTKRWLPAALHALTYGLPFLVFGASLPALAVIVSTHLVIDRWRLARHVIWAKNHVAPRSEWRGWGDSQPTGYPSDVPPWLSVWLMIAADNAIHVLINYLALRFWS